MRERTFLPLRPTLHSLCERDMVVARLDMLGRVEESEAGRWADLFRVVRSRLSV